MADIQKSAFSLSSATIMLGKAFTDDVFALYPSAHSVGMVSQANIGLDSSITELMNGVAQVTVDAKRTNVKPTITGNVFEFTAQNMLRAHAVSGSAIQIKRGVLTAGVAGGGTSITIASDPIPGESASAITGLGDIPSGSWILIQRVNGEQDYVFATKTTAAATGTGPYVLTLAAPYAIPAAMSFATGARVWVVQPIGVGNIDADDLFCVKITGTLTNFDRPVTYCAPKVRMVKGFEMSFNETQYNSMPWEMQPLIMSATENASLSRPDIGTRSSGILFVGG